jgi:hypothetical protein
MISSNLFLMRNSALNFCRLFRPCWLQDALHLGPLTLNVVAFSCFLHASVIYLFQDGTFPALSTIEMLIPM